MPALIIYSFTFFNNQTVSDILFPFSWIGPGYIKYLTNI